MPRIPPVFVIRSPYLLQPLVRVKSRDELMDDIVVAKIMSAFAKIALLILDPTRRPPLPTRKDAIDFLYFLDESCDKQIRTTEQSLK